MNSLEYIRKQKGITRKIAADILSITPRKLKKYEEATDNPIIFVGKFCTLYNIKFEELENLEKKLNEVTKFCRV